MKGLKVLQVLPDEGGRTKSLFELCLNFRITISPLENWPQGLIVFEKKKQIWIITALGFLYSCCNINEDKQNAKCSDKGAKILPANRFASRKQIYKTFRTSAKEIFLESESFTSSEEFKSERCWLWEWSYIGGTVHNVSSTTTLSNSIKIQRSLFAARVWKLVHLPWKQNEETSCFSL